MVDIEKHQGQGETIALGPLDFVVRQFLDLQPRPLAGQAVGIGQALQLQVAVAQFLLGLSPAPDLQAQLAS
ncbi:hypothetical protein D3C72_1908620 [compost metagenome]